MPSTRTSKEQLKRSETIHILYISSVFMETFPKRKQKAATAAFSVSKWMSSNRQRFDSLLKRQVGRYGLLTSDLCIGFRSVINKLFESSGACIARHMAFAEKGVVPFMPENFYSRVSPKY